MKDRTELPYISIITVCYNSERTIAETIKSVVGQTYDNYEYIIIDGASTDSTVEIIKKYQSEYSGKIRMVSEKDRGIYNAMNKGIRLARGKLIGILNSDDYYEKDALSIAAESYIPDRKQVIYGFLRYIKDDKEYMVTLYSHEFLHERMMNHPACFVSKKIYHEIGVYNEEYKSAADYDFFLKLRRNDVLFVPVYRIFTNFRLGGMSSSYIGYVEAARVRYQHKCIRLFRYIGLLFWYRLRFLLKK